MCALLLFTLLGPQSILVASAQTGSDAEPVEIVPSTGGVASHPPSIDSSGRLAVLEAGNGAELWDLEKGRLIRKLASSQVGTATAAAISSDGSRVAAGGFGKGVTVWDARTGRVLASLDSQLDGADAIALSKDGRLVIYGGSGKSLGLGPAGFKHGPTAIIRDVDSGRIIQALGDRLGRAMSVSLSPTGDLVVVGDLEGKIRLIDLDGQLRRVWSAHGGRANWTRALAFSPDGTRLASGGNDREAKIWETATGKLLQTLPGHDGEGGSVYGVSWSPDGNLLATVDSRRVRIWNARSGTLLRSGSFEPGVVGSDLSAVAYAPGGNSLFVNGLTRVDADTLEFQNRIGARLSGSIVPTHGPTGSEVLIASGSELSLHRLDAATGRLRKFLSEPDIKSGLAGIVASRGGTHIAGYGSHRAEHYDKLFYEDSSANAGIKILVHSIKDSGFRQDWRLAISPNGQTVAARSKKGIRVFDIASATARDPRLPESFDPHAPLAFSADGRMLAVAGPQSVLRPRYRSWRTLRLWDVPRGKEIAQVRLDDGATSSTASCSRPTIGRCWLRAAGRWITCPWRAEGRRGACKSVATRSFTRPISIQTGSSRRLAATMASFGFWISRLRASFAPSAATHRAFPKWLSPWKDSASFLGPMTD